VKRGQTAPSRARWIDFHCHLDLYKNHRELIAQCDANGVATLAVTTTPKAWPGNREMAAHSRHVRVALGLHPQLIANHACEIDEFERYLPESRYVGEVGLDAGPKYFRSLPEQRRIFERVLCLCAEQGGKILTVHSVRAVKEVLDMTEKHFAAAQSHMVLHWFTGTKAQARRAVELGCYFSINARMLQRPVHRALVQSLPIENLLTETDGPFVTIGSRPAEPIDVKETVAQLARLRSVAFEDMGQQLLNNLRTLVSAQPVGKWSDGRSN
jgi:TatD DNase family protein